MDNDDVIGLGEDRCNSIDLSDWLRCYSFSTWERIEFTRARKGLRISETTITENLVFGLWVLAKHSELPVKIFEATNEKVNGNDLEIVVETSKGHLIIPCQAKIIKEGNKYPTINHKVNGEPQIDLLIRYATRLKGLPVYLLYNWCGDWTINKIIEKQSGIEIQNFGCSLVNAKIIRNDFYAVEKRRWEKIPCFQDLHPEYAMPLHTLIGDSIKEWLINFGSLRRNTEIKYYSKDEIYDQKGWKDLNPSPRIGFIPSNNIAENKISTQNDANFNFGFSPKFRIILSRNKEVNIYRLS